MAINETREIVIEANPEEILDVITDEQVVAYTWSKNKVSWTLVSSGQQRSQDASYTLTPDRDKTKVTFQLSVDPVVPLPGFVLKRAIKGTVDTGTKGLRDRVLELQKGQA
ncbi:cyclase [Mycobacterium sp.]|uniref:cyclase n=1 Tax=Mycobacterium sp. TaxID=1785 RepID=UPI003BAF0D62